MSALEELTAAARREPPEAPTAGRRGMDEARDLQGVAPRRHVTVADGALRDLAMAPRRRPRAQKTRGRAIAALDSLAGGPRPAERMEDQARGALLTLQDRTAPERYVAFADGALRDLASAPRKRDRARKPRGRAVRALDALTAEPRSSERYEDEARGALLSLQDCPAPERHAAAPAGALLEIMLTLGLPTVGTTLPFSGIDVKDNSSNVTVATLDATVGEQEFANGQLGDVLSVWNGQWGINSQGQPYFDPSGATVGEVASVSWDPSAGNLVLTR